MPITFSLRQNHETQFSSASSLNHFRRGCSKKENTIMADELHETYDVLVTYHIYA